MTIHALPRPVSDARLPALARLLDPDAVSDVLGRAFCVAADNVRVVSVRYKPRRRLVVEYDVAADPTTSRIAALLDAKADLSRLAAPPDIAWDADTDCLLQRWPFDAALPALSLRAGDVACRFGIDAPQRLERLGYKPFVRATVRLGAHVVKLYASEEKWRRAASALDRVTRAGLSDARLVQVAPDLKATVQRFVDGAAPEALAAAAPAGALLRRLHALDSSGLVRVRPEDRLAESARAAALVAVIAPPLAARVEALRLQLAGELPSAAGEVLSHGDFESGQLIAGEEQLTLVDVDALCAAPCADDVGRYAAHAVRGQDGDLEAVQEVLAGVVDGYGLRPDGVEWYAAASILARAAAPFRRQLPDWPERVEAFVAVAERVADP